MRIYQLKPFARWARKHGIGNELLEQRALALALAAKRERTSGDKLPFGASSLGGGLYKLRFALPGKGARGGARTIVAFRHEDVIFYLHGFKKNQQENLRSREVATLKLEADTLLEMRESTIQIAVKAGVLILISEV